MAALNRDWAAELVHVWFDKLRPRDWFVPDLRVDELLRRRFERELTGLRMRPTHEFCDDPHTALASVLLFDQLPRNLYRGTQRAFATDPLARRICHETLRRGWDTQLSRVQRQFLAMPLMHSEDIADQRLSLAYFAQLGRNYGLPFARSHYRMIAHFGRYPHRNDVLGRKSTPAEERAVKAGNSW